VSDDDPVVLQQSKSNRFDGREQQALTEITRSGARTMEKKIKRLLLNRQHKSSKIKITR
jgi:hypothetical protein